MTVILEACDVSFGYSGGQTIVDGFSAKFHAGTTTAITGPSGRGKSTMLYLLGLMLAPRSGEVVVESKNASRAQDKERADLRARKFGFVFQDAALDSSRTVLDNVTEPALYRAQSRKELEPAARDLLARFKVDVPAHRKPGQVSGGQAQRIALCRALLGSPKILLADEPTGNLDPATAQVVIDALREHAHTGSAVIVVTHSPDVAAVCDAEVRL